jgi:probable rRNA maturation factor
MDAMQGGQLWPSLFLLKMVTIDKALTGVNVSALTRFARRAQTAAGLGGDVDVLITRDRRMRELNRRFRGKNQATDVLSFAVAAAPLPNGHKRAGDIAISAQMASRNARRYGHSLEREIRVLILHGMLHLAGYDHEHDHGRMARRERELRRRLHLPLTLTERAAAAPDRDPTARRPR